MRNVALFLISLLISLGIEPLTPEDPPPVAAGPDPTAVDTFGVFHGYFFLHCREFVRGVAEQGSHIDTFVVCRPEAYRDSMYALVYGCMRRFGGVWFDERRCLERPSLLTTLCVAPLTPDLRPTSLVEPQVTLVLDYQVLLGARRSRACPEPVYPWSKTRFDTVTCRLDSVAVCAVFAMTDAAMGYYPCWEVADLGDEYPVPVLAILLRMIYGWPDS